MMRKRLESYRLTLSMLVMVIAAAPVWAQSTATLQGNVTDSQNAVMPGVSITITNAATGIERTTASDAAGAYAAASLAPGHYRVVAHIEGFQDQTREVDLGPAETVVLNLRLGVAPLAENVTVSGAAPLIDTATVSI